MTVRKSCSSTKISCFYEEVTTHTELSEGSLGMASEARDGAEVGYATPGGSLGMASAGKTVAGVSLDVHLY